MDTEEKVMHNVLKDLGVDTTDIEGFHGRFVASDNFTTVFVARKGLNIHLWTDAHKKFIATKWDVVKSGLYIPKNEYDKLMVQKLSECLTKPEVEIILKKTYGDFEVIAYTDTTDSLVEQARNFKGD